MIESIQGRIPQTTRLSFDANEVSDEHVPAFLRRAKERYKEPSVDYDRTNVIDIRSPRNTTPIVIPVEADAIVVTEEVAQTPIMEDATMEILELSPDFIKPADLGGLTVDQLREQELAVRKAIEEKQKAEKKAVLEQIKQVMSDYKIPLEDLVDFLGGLKVKRKGTPAPMKYRDPDTGAEWSGRGKEPSWIKDQDRDKFLID